MRERGREYNKKVKIESKWVKIRKDPEFIIREKKYPNLIFLTVLAFYLLKKRGWWISIIDYTPYDFEIPMEEMKSMELGRTKSNKKRKMILDI